jgi:DNA repair protein RecO (recombination protein O)
LTATALPERHPYPSLWQALGGLLDAICHAPSARGWAAALVDYEALLLRELGYGGERPDGENLAQVLAAFDKLAGPLDHYLLADRRGDVMAARARLRELLGRMVE